MAAASFSERRGGSFFSVCLSRSPLGALIVAMLASARGIQTSQRGIRDYSLRNYLRPLHPPPRLSVPWTQSRKGRAQK